jgi:MFS family permease
MNDKSEGHLFLLCLVAAMGGLLFGYDWVVIGGAKPFYEAYFGLTGVAEAWRAGFAMSSAVFGCIIGAIGFGRIPDRFGRKPSLIAAAVFFTVSAIWTAFATTYWSFILARVLGGFGIGLASNVSPVYIAEISPARLRGRLVAVNQLTIVVGILAAQLVNLLIYNCSPVETSAAADAIRSSWNGHLGWRWMFGAETIPAALFLVLAFVIPESPRWLATRGRTDDSGTGWRVLLEPKVFKVVALGVFLAAFQQWCGLNVVFNYAEEIFKAAGYSVSGMMFNIVITGVVNFVFTIAAMALVDRWGRRPLMLIGAGGLAVFYALLGGCYHLDLHGAWVLVMVLAVIACYAMTLAPVTWVLLSEIFPNRVRGTAMAASVGALWIACYGLTLTFPPINAALGAAGTFWLYGAICVVGLAVIFFGVPETKGRTLEQIEGETK